MLKKLFIAFILVVAAPVFAGSFMNHEKFVHLTFEEQKKIVISMMDVMVEMEQQYHKNKKTTDLDQERFERYSDIMRKFSNFLIPEAHAARNVRYGQYINELRRLVSTRNGNKCLYGGWISEMSGDKCTHPNFSASRSLYQTESGCNDGRNQITCNPAIFGFKNVGQKTLFCVPAGQNGADNSSRDCMVKALKNPPPAGASTPDERIRNIIAGIEANPQDANAVFDFLLQACACEPGKVSPQMNRHYAEYMRPHQTCLGILRMMAEYGPQCSAASQPFDQNQLNFLSRIKTLLTDAQISDDANVTTSYRNGLAGLRSENAEFRNSEAAVCGTSPAVITGGTCPEDRRRNNNLACCEENQIANPEKTECITRPSTDDASCPANRRKTDGSCCEENTTWNAQTNACAPAGGGNIVVRDDTATTCPAGQTGTPPNCVTPGPRPDPVPAVCPAGQTGTPPNCTPAVTACPDGQTGTPPNCTPAPAVCPAGQTGTPPNCTAEVACTEANRRRPIPEAQRADRDGATCECTDGSNIPENGQCPEIVACTAENNRVPIPEAERAANGGKDCKCSNGQAIPENGQCAATPATGINISVTSTNKPDKSNATILLTITGVTNPSDTYNIIWFRKGWPGTTTPPRDTTPATTSTLPDTNPDGTTVVTTADRQRTSERPGTGQTRVPGQDGKTTFDVERNPTVDYEMCTRLVKKSDGSLEGTEKCAKVEKKPAAPARSGGGGYMPQQQMLGPTRGGSSNATFNGIR